MGKLKKRGRKKNMGEKLVEMGVAGSVDKVRVWWQKPLPGGGPDKNVVHQVGRAATIILNSA